MSDKIMRIPCASGTDSFSEIRLSRRGGLLRLEVPPQADLTPEAARNLANALYEMGYGIEHYDRRDAEVFTA